MSLPLLKPELYRREGTLSHPHAPALLGGRCERCGYVFFPLQHYGCEQCGAPGDALHPHALSGRGTLDASAPVHLHSRPGRQAPFTVVAVHLHDGPRVRTLLGAGTTAGNVVSGAEMVATLEEVVVPGSEPAATALDLRFVPA
jgi:uncharacterized protein